MPTGMSWPTVSVLLIVLLALSGCNGVGRNLSSGAKTVTDEDFQQGTKALAYRFHPSTPPSEVPQESMEEIVVILENRGSGDITEGFITLIPEESYIELIGAQRRRIDAEGRNKNNPGGTTIDVSFPIRTKKLDFQSQEHASELIANVCYDYSTEFNDVVCIDPDPYTEDERINDKKICHVADLSSSGQGGPIAVEKIGVSMVRDNSGMIIPTFRITIRNKASGMVVQSDRVSDLCSGFPLKPDELNRVSLYASLGDQELDCDGNSFQLYKREATVSCVLSSGIDSSFGEYETPIHVRLSYGYSDSISKKFSIIR